MSVFYQNVPMKGLHLRTDKQLIGINQDLTGRVVIIEDMLILEIH
jgi:hypothetical protein